MMAFRILEIASVVVGVSATIVSVAITVSILRRRWHYDEAGMAGESKRGKI